MAQFKAFSNEVEVNHQTVMAFINSMPQGQNKRREILEKHGIVLDTKEWYNQQKWLDAFKEVAEKYGEMNLFLIGKAIIENADFPPMNSIGDALNAIDVAYHMNHRINGKIMFDSETGEKLKGIGNYKLSYYNEKEQRAIMVCDNPYPSKFDEGIITQIVRNFQTYSFKCKILLDTTKETRKDGANTCTYNISW